jgi:outer membrane protein assembly factor BamB
MSIMEETGYAASTAATNGVYIAAIFADGQTGCFDLEGSQIWIRSLGIPASAYGYASSLTVYEDRLIIQMDQDYEPGRSKLIALDMKTGKTLWETDRPVPNSWTSPTVVQMGGRMQILTSGSPWVMGYDPADGKELWRVECLGGDVAPTQVAAEGKVFAVEPYSKLVAIDPAATADGGTAGRVVWTAEGSIPDICSPITNGQLVWTLDTGGTLGCYDVRDGSKVYAQNLEAMFQASPSLAGDTLYLLSTKGKMVILKAGRTVEKMRENELGEATYASPAFGSGRIYLRGIRHLYCIETKP